MDILTLTFVFSTVMALDWMGFKYQGMTWFVAGGILSLFGLANMAADNSVAVSIASTPYTLTAAAQPHDFDTFLAVFSLLAIMQFFMVIERNLKGADSGRAYR